MNMYGFLYLYIYYIIIIVYGSVCMQHTHTPRYTGARNNNHLPISMCDMSSFLVKTENMDSIMG